MQEFVLSHSDNLEASGFVQHLKLPHYVDFQSELALALAAAVLLIRFKVNSAWLILGGGVAGLVVSQFAAATGG